MGTLQEELSSKLISGQPIEEQIHAKRFLIKQYERAIETNKVKVREMALAIDKLKQRILGEEHKQYDNERALDKARTEMITLQNKQNNEKE